MKRSRRTFDPSFKLEVVNTIKNQGLSVSQVAKDMNLTESTVRRWVQQVDEELAGRPGKGLPLTPDQQRIRQFEAQLRQFKEDNEILKKLRSSLPEPCAEVSVHRTAGKEGPPGDAHHGNG